jgi:hypothetical protein
MVDTVLRKTEKVISPVKHEPSLEPIKSQPYLEIQNERHQIFISYSRQDSAWMREIRDHVDRLPDFRIDSWVDKNRMGPGDRIDNAIQDGLDNSNIAILLISPTFVESKYIQTKEIPWILQRQKEGRLKVIYIPIFDVQDERKNGKTAVEEYLATSQLDTSLSAITFGNALEATFERQDKRSRDGKVKEVVDGIRRVIDPYFNILEQTLADDYRIVGKVAEGASAVVYRARKEGIQGDLAVKVLKNTPRIKIGFSEVSIKRVISPI